MEVGVGGRDVRAETLANRAVSKAACTPGTNSPMITPTIIARRIAGVRSLSVRLNFLTSTTSGRSTACRTVLHVDGFAYLWVPVVLQTQQRSANSADRLPVLV